MKFRTIYILSIFCFFYCSAYSQPIKKTKPLNELVIIDTNLYIILDSVIFFEKKCDYYNDSLLFTIDINKRNFCNLQISSYNNIDNAFDFFKPILGYFYYKNHLFIVYDTDIKTLFEITHKIKKFEYREIPDTYILIVDCSHTYWYYWYIENKFIFRDRSSPCE